MLSWYYKVHCRYDSTHYCMEKYQNIRQTFSSTTFQEPVTHILSCISCKRELKHVFSWQNRNCDAFISTFVIANYGELISLGKHFLWLHFLTSTFFIDIYLLTTFLKARVWIVPKLRWMHYCNNISCML